MELSVVICTFNGASKLPKLLDSLSAQKEASDLPWEIVVIDNNSTDNTASVVASCKENWRKDIPLKYFFEQRQGLAFARRCAIAKTEASLIGFLDDDTCPNEDWVCEILKFAEKHPQAGAFGSEISPVFEVSPPDGFNRIAPLFAIIKRGKKPFIYAKRPGVLPAGAGMVIRKDAWLAHVPEIPVFTGVSGTSLSNKGEDVETLSYIRDGGWEVWHNPAMKISHYIPAVRLERNYMVRLCHSVGTNRFPLRMSRYKAWQRAFILPAYILNDLRKLIIYTSKNADLIDADIVSTCEFVLLRDTCLSPIYHLIRFLRSDD